MNKVHENALHDLEKAKIHTQRTTKNLKKYNHYTDGDYIYANQKYQYYEQFLIEDQDQQAIVQDRVNQSKDNLDNSKNTDSGQVLN